MISEEIDNLKCSICQYNFDNSVHVPKMLPDCGHSFCALCLNEGLTYYNVAICPACGLENYFDNLSNLVTNESLLNEIAKKNLSSNSNSISLTSSTQSTQAQTQNIQQSEIKNEDEDFQNLINRYVNMKIDDEIGFDDNAQTDKIAEEMNSKLLIESKTESNSNTSNENKSIHKKITCDNCRVSPIVGDRYKCKSCPDYDLCKTCFNFKAHGHHVFAKFTKPVGGILVAVHEGVRCDGCGVKPMIGRRFKCHGCDNYDFCEECMETRTHAHGFIQINQPIKGFTFIVHPKVRCSGCGLKDIIGTRYKCKECDDFNTCELCAFHVNHQHESFEIKSN